MKLSKKYLAVIGGVALIVLLIGVTARASEEAAEKRRPAQSRIPGRERSKEMLETIRTVRTIETLKLTEQQIAQFLPKQRQMKEMRQNYSKVRKVKVEKLAKLLESKTSPRVLEKVLAEMKADEEKFQAKKKALQTEIDSILTPEQRAKLIIFERDFRKEMRKMLKRFSKREKSSEKRRGTKSQKEGSPRGSERGK
ncbi:hypothetical protein KAT51_02315 [bacterium]|nr:hypothetical protein [bacterium]